MAYQVIWAPSARLDLGRPFHKANISDGRHLADFPQSGRVVPEFNDPGIREVIRRPCRIVYRVKAREQTVEIARVWHAARGIPQL